MEDVSGVPQQTKIRISLQKSDWAGVMRILASRLEQGVSYAATGKEDQQSITMTYENWEGILKDLVEYAEENDEAQRQIPEPIMRAILEIEHTLVSLQDEQERRIAQGEG